MNMFRLTAAMAYAMMTGIAFAQTAAPGGVTAPQAIGVVGSSVNTSRGPALVTGTTGSSQTIMIPGSAVGGWVTSNGNGTSTVMVPGGLPQVVLAPR